MPDISTDLFRWIAVAFVAVATILLVVIAVRVAGIAKAFKRGGDWGSIPAAAAPAATGWELDAAPVASAQLAETLAGAQLDAESGAADEGPSEQPFEKDGRWWFRRGGELLVYEETTGEWVPASGSNPSESEPAPTEAEPEAEVVAAEVVAAEVVANATGGEDEPVAASGTFWKCPACGAINGSTASTCRMCFAARP